MKEFEFIRSIQPKYYKQPTTIKGIGDDAAILRYTNVDIITTVDTMVEGIHFSSVTTKPFHIGYRALAANISDIAAMGGNPTAYLVSIVVPDDKSIEELQEIYQGMNALAEDFHLDLIGGDTVSGKQLMISITVLGTVASNKARYRSTAQNDDIVFVTGTLGDAACGLHLLLSEKDVDNQYQYFIDRHRKPTPRVTFINGCAEIDRITLNDVSDGIANEANEIAEASGKTLIIDYEKVPSHPLLQHFSQEQQFTWKLSGGGDFELIGTVNDRNWDRLQYVATRTNTTISRIGKVKDDPKTNGNVWLRTDKSLKKLEKSGYTHLRR